MEDEKKQELVRQVGYRGKLGNLTSNALKLDLDTRILALKRTQVM